MKKLQTITLGCSKNKVDTEHILSHLDDLYEIVPEGEDIPVDVILLNTCGFIGDAKEESVQAVLDAATRKNRGLAEKVVVFGCLSQRYMNELPDLIPEVDAWYGAREFDPVIRELGAEPQEAKRAQRYLTTPSHYAYLKISEGCDRRCSYCAIPFIRGAHKSVPMEKLVEEATNLAEQGVKELIIIAQDTTYYGLDLYKKRSLAQLLEKLCEVEGIEWIRIHYSYPAQFPEDVLDVMAKNPKICKYLDIPLQHASTKVLDLMRRSIDGPTTQSIIDKIREKVPGCVLRTTLIVGHPGEDKREYEKLLRFVEKNRFDRLGAFTYSEEEGTYGAANLKDTVRQSTKQKRYEQLMELQSDISYSINQSRIGDVERVIVDSFSNDVLVCRSQKESPEVDGEILVGFDSKKFDAQKLIGKFVNVKIMSANEYDLLAEIIDIEE